MRALIFLLLIIGLFFLIRAVINRISQLGQEIQPKENQAKQAESPKPMVNCELCQVHLPETEALCITDIKGKQHCFCSKEHLEAFIENNGD